ncbi:MAG: PAS domain S-box protein [Gemmatimonadetes bacterium]|nr:PAS domain S-box protein [Gemmatimonadota bacterium]
MPANQGPPAATAPAWGHELKEQGIGYYIADAAGCFAYCNPAVTAATGYRAEELMGRRSVDLVVDEEREAVTLQYRAWAADPAVSDVAMEFRVRGKDGRVFWVEQFTHIERTADGRHVRYCNFLREITDRKATEAALRASQGRYDRDVGKAVDALRSSVSLLEATLESTADGILVVGIDRSIARFNRRFADMWRIPDAVLATGDDAQALGFVLSQLKDPDGFLRTVERLYANPQAESMDTFELSDARMFERYSRPQVVDGVTVGRVWSFRDVSERRRAELERQELEAGLRRAQKLEAMGTLAGGIAHDFNNILTAIISSAEQTIEDLPSGHEAQGSLRTILQAGHRAANLVRRILLFSRGEVGDRTTIMIDAVIRDAMGLLRPSLPSTVEIVASLPHPASLAIHADATQVQQVIVNLCTNAWHAMRARGGGRISIDAAAVELAPGDVAREGIVVAPGRMVRITVTDNGCGMPPAILPRIFDPFFTTKPVGEGTGLGLAMVHGVVRAHGGDVSVSSTEGVGTSFRLYFPAAVGQVEEPVMGLDRARGAGQLVLLVDDEPDVRSVGARTMEHLGYRAIAVPSGEAALGELRRRGSEVALLITDLTMPGMSGLDLARDARALYPDLPVVLCTGYGSRETEAEARALGVRVVLPKPHSLHDLGRAAATALNAVPRGRRVAPASAGTGS